MRKKVYDFTVDNQTDIGHQCKITVLHNKNINLWGSGAPLIILGMLTLGAGLFSCLPLEGVRISSCLVLAGEGKSSTLLLEGAGVSSCLLLEKAVLPSSLPLDRVGISSCLPLVRVGGSSCLTLPKKIIKIMKTEIYFLSLCINFIPYQEEIYLLKINIKQRYINRKKDKK